MRMKDKDMHRVGILAIGLLCSTAALAEPLSNEAAMQLLQRLNQMEGEVSNLRGENEQLRNDLKNLQDKQQEDLQQVGERMDKLNDGTKPSDAPASGSADTGGSSADAGKPADGSNPSPAADSGDKPPKDDPNGFYSYGTGKSDDKNPPKSDADKANDKQDAGSSTSGTTDSKATDTATSGSTDSKSSDTTASSSATDKTSTSNKPVEAEERAVYDEAFNTLLKNPKDSIPLFRAFLKDYPASPLAGSAQYWIGEALYADHDYKGAVDEFLMVLKEHKGSDKAPGAALKLGFSFYELKEWEKARKTLEDVISFFPDSADTITKARERLDKMKAEGH